MAGIKYDHKQFWQALLDALKAGMPPRPEKDYSNKEIEAFYGISAPSIKSLFEPKGRNYQSRWSDVEMGLFNAGTPPWTSRQHLLAAVLWGSRAAHKCKSLSVRRDEFESHVIASFVEAGTDLDNWRNGCAAADDLAAQRFQGDFAADVEGAVSAYAAHFIGKITNSNASTGAVVALPVESPLPYLYSGSLGDIELDCAVNSSPDASGYRRMLDCSRRVREQGRDVASPEDIAIGDAFDEAMARLGTGEDREINRSVDWRLRQIVLPRGKGYVSLTPLGAAGISAAVAAHGEAIWAPTISLPIGGSKPGNVSSISAVTLAHVYDVPSLSSGGIALYMRLLHRGYRINKKNKDLSEAIAYYGQWLGKNAFVDGRDSMKAAEIEMCSSGIVRIVALILSDIQSRSNSIQDYLETLDDDAREKGIEAIQEKGVIEAAIVRGIFAADFVDALATSVVRSINGHKYKVGRDIVQIMLGPQDKARLHGVVQTLVSRSLKRKG